LLTVVEADASANGLGKRNAMTQRAKTLVLRVAGSAFLLIALSR
jgi:hypothetical protein